MGQGPLKRNAVERFEREIVLVELNGLNEITISKRLERIQSGSTNLRDIFSTLEQMNNEEWMINRCTGMEKHLTNDNSFLRQTLE